MSQNMLASKNNVDKMNPTTLNSLRKILFNLRTGKLGATNADGGCSYDDCEGRHCAIGCLFSNEQLEQIHSAGLNDSGIVELNGKLPTMLETTGFTLNQARTIQSWHDSCFGDDPVITTYAFETMLESLTEGWITSVRRFPNPNIMSNEMTSFVEEKEEVQA